MAKPNLPKKISFEFKPNLCLMLFSSPTRTRFCQVAGQDDPSIFAMPYSSADQI